jgi:hypothetical protein
MQAGHWVNQPKYVNPSQPLRVTQVVASTTPFANDLGGAGQVRGRAGRPGLFMRQSLCYLLYLHRPPQTFAHALQPYAVKRPRLMTHRIENLNYRCRRHQYRWPCPGPWPCPWGAHSIPMTCPSARLDKWPAAKPAASDVARVGARACACARAFCTPARGGGVGPVRLLSKPKLSAHRTPAVLPHSALTATTPTTQPPTTTSAHGPPSCLEKWCW